MMMWPEICSYSFSTEEHNNPANTAARDSLAVNLLNISIYLIINCSPNIRTKLALPRGIIINELIISHDRAGGSLTSGGLHTLTK